MAHFPEMDSPDEFEDCSLIFLRSKTGAPVGWTCSWSLGAQLCWKTWVHGGARVQPWMEKVPSKVIGKSSEAHRKMKVYPLVNCYITKERSTILQLGKLTNYFDGHFQKRCNSHYQKLSLLLSSGLGGSDKRSVWGIHIPFTYSLLNGEPATELRIDFPNHLIVSQLVNQLANLWFIYVIPMVFGDIPILPPAREIRALASRRGTTLDSSPW